MNQADALNLWDIEMRIKKLHEELDVLHEEKDKLLGREKILPADFQS